MTYYPSREELRSDITEITTAILATALKENNRVLVRMINEDLDDTNSKIDLIERRLMTRNDRHVSDPHAHEA